MWARRAVLFPRTRHTTTQNSVLHIAFLIFNRQSEMSDLISDGIKWFWLDLRQMVSAVSKARQWHMVVQIQMESDDIKRKAQTAKKGISEGFVAIIGSYDSLLIKLLASSFPLLLNLFSKAIIDLFWYSFEFCLLLLKGANKQRSQSYDRSMLPLSSFNARQMRATYQVLKHLEAADTCLKNKTSIYYARWKVL